MILADENLPASIIAALESAGFAVVQIADLDAGAGDDAVLRYAVQRGLIVVTQDKDFGDLVYQQGHRHAGVVQTSGHAFVTTGVRRLSSSTANRAVCLQIVDA